MAKLDATGHRWTAGLANYNFNIHYRYGKSNVEADALSSIDWEKCDETIQANSIQAIVAAAITVHGTNHIKAISCSPQTNESILLSIPDDTLIFSKAIMQLSRQNHPTYLKTELSKLDTLSHLGVDIDSPLNPKCTTPSDWVEAQSRDKNVGEIIHLFKAKELQGQKGTETESQEMKQFIRQQNKLHMRDGILYHKNEIQEVDCPDRNTMPLVLPESYRKQALQGCHDDLGHLGIERTIDILRDQFYWPGMMEDTVRHIKQCERCLRLKALPGKAPMKTVDATYPMELVHMDYLTIVANEGGKDVHILMIRDHFMRYVQAIVTSSQTAKCTAQNLWDKFIVHYGLPEKILTDQAHNFESDLLKALCEVAQVKKIRISGYHPQMNGQCECFMLP